MDPKKGGKKEEQDEGKGEEEDLGSRLGQSNENSGFWRDPNLIVNWMNGKWKINNQKFRMMVQKTQNMMD